MIDDEFACRAEVTFRGERLCLNRIIAQIHLEDILPPRHPILDPISLHGARETEERRQRFVDLISAEFAHALTEAIYKLSRAT